MAYEIERTDEFTDWWDELSEREQIEVAKIVGVLAEKGPNLKRPYAGKIEGSKKIPNLKELVIQVAGDPYRVFFMFDKRKAGILLLGARKTGGKKVQAAGIKREFARLSQFTSSTLQNSEKKG